MAELEEGQNVLCTVERIEGTTVFVRIENNGTGTINVSEIAPGRIRNLRDYVVPEKKIVCKILEVESNNIHLSLRRVTEKEKKEVLERFEREKNSINILRSVIKEKAEELVQIVKEKEKMGVHEFLQYCKIAPDKLEKYLKKDEALKICKILQEKKEKLIEAKKEFFLSSPTSGITTIKKILAPYKDKINYLAAGRFVIKIKAEDYKKVNFEIQRIMQDIGIQAKKENCKFEVK